ncbi:serine/threonine-protein kinase polo [Dermacentor variabilis]|uniref:serine/threonine-protein kinase polo n=1 Tax=Dermacentor variabilis TaxID=34621 RepID=UPI003F5B4072
MASAIPTRTVPTVTKDLPDIVVDKKGKKEYVRGKFLGKGGFAKCYELTDKATNTIYAGKVVSKALLVKSHQKEKMAQEIQIHRSLNHKHIVGFHSYFEDDKNVYIVLELCSRRSLMEMHRRRKMLTEAEARYFLHQILLACRYLVQQKVIHRDLKLGNLLLNDCMELKVGDFGLATRVDFDGERKKTLCGTPNYIAPEILAKKGHSFEVDIWSIGCILSQQTPLHTPSQRQPNHPFWLSTPEDESLAFQLPERQASNRPKFTLIVGHPPFETPTLKETYIRIKKNEYHVPSTVSSPARNLIRRMLQQEPERRPNIEAIMQDEFMTCGPLPSRLPTSCLTTEPRFDTLNATLSVNGRRPLLERNEGRELEAKVTPIRNHPDKEAKPVQCLKPQLPAPAGAQKAAADSPARKGAPQEAHLTELQRLLRRLCNARPPELRFERPDEAEDPASVPVFWVSKWVDYTDKYGLGYQLCDNSIGVVFNDNTRIILLNNNLSVTYVDENSIEHYHTVEEFPPSLEKKMTLLKYFCTYMKQYLLMTGEDVSPRECDNLVRLPCLGTWLRTRSAISFYLTNGTVQINFFQDHTKLILCPLMSAVSYIDNNRVFHTYRLETLHKGCPPDLFSRLKYARTILDRLASTPS